MKITTIYFIILILLTGCVTPKPKKEILEDVSYSVNKKGEVKLDKTYKHENGKVSEKSEFVSKPGEKLFIDEGRGYERIPSFKSKKPGNIILKEKESRKKDKIVIKQGKVKVSVEAIPLNEFIDLAFGNVLKLNYTVTEAVRKIKNPITLNMSDVQPTQQVFDVISKLLSFEGIKIKKENGIIFISSAKNVIKKDISSYIGYGKKVSDNILDSQDIVQFVPFEYIGPKKVTNLLKYAGVSRAVGYMYPSGNVSMMKGQAGEIRKAIEIIKLLDRPYIEGKTPFLVEFKNIEVSDFITTIKTIFASNGIPVSKEPNSVGILLNPIVELNSLLVMSSKEEWMDMLLFWKEKLDTRSEASANPRFYTYQVKNRKADELSDAINSVIELKLSTLDSKTKTVNNKDKKSKLSDKKIKETDNKIKADLPTNTLMMKMLPSEYRELLPLIETLDALPLQVLTEVTLAEVTLTDTFNLGFEYTLKNNAALGSSVITSLSDTVTSAFGGSGFAATYASKNLEAVINAYAEDKLLSILSKPKILILNNKTGTINVGTQVPVITSETSADDLGGATPTINRNITYQNTGVQVGLTPTINSNGILTMNINLVLSEAQLNSTSNIDSPLIVNRTLSTSLTLKHGETVLLGGLISKNNSSTDNGVPLLMDIPLLGSLFKSKSDKIVKTELIMLIRPSIIQNPVQMSEKTRKYRSLLKLLDKYSLF